MTSTGGPRDFSDITEVPGAGATREQRARLLSRYHTAARQTAGGRVLEVACGAGMGLGYLARSASWVVGGDYTWNLVRTAQAHYAGRQPLTQFDAHAMPFAGQTFDCLVIFEAVYYMRDQALVFREARRVLRPGGRLLISTVNPDWSGFSPSRSSTRYLSVPDFHRLLLDAGFQRVECYGAFAAAQTSLVGSVVALIRRAAAALNLVPMTLAGRAALKRLFYGPLVALPDEVDDTLGTVEPLVPLPTVAPEGGFKIIYAVAFAE